MASNFDLKKFVSEFTRYARIICPWEPDLGIMALDVKFKVVRGRLEVLLFPCEGYDWRNDHLNYADNIATLLFHTVRDINLYQGFSNLGKDRTFVLSVDPDAGGLVYGIGGYWSWS